ncbi:MAG: acyltransferase [Rhizobiales bacterium]|nr:acyltransferase [Hyphomicrobiales bacterium]
MFERHPFYQNHQSIDVLRGLAALLVFLSHADAHLLVNIEFFTPYRGYAGRIGVYLFFILSGYLIWGSADRTLGRPGGLYEYAVHRATRVMPLYYVALAFAILLFPLLSSFQQNLSAYTIFRTITFTQALNPNVSRAINPVLWTLTLEMLFYICIPFLHKLKKYFVVIIALTIFASWSAAYHPNSNLAPFLRLFFLFVIGMAIANFTLTPKPLFFWSALAVAVIMTVDRWSPMDVSVAWTIVIFSGVMVYRRYEGTRLWGVLAFFGLISYSLYIWHYMLIEMIGPLTMQWSMRNPALSAVLFTAFCALFSWVSYQLIEKPGQTRLRQWCLDWRKKRLARSQA